MALHNVDKSLGGDRSNPQPNTHDTSFITGFPVINVPRPAHGTLSTNYTEQGSAPTNTAGLFSFLESGVMEVINDGSVSTITSEPHGLGFTPIAFGSLNNATTTGINDPVNIPLPGWLGVGFSGGAINFTVWASVMADALNVYTYTLNASGSPVTFFVTYYLYKQPAL